MSKLTY